MYILTLKNITSRIHLGECRSTTLFNPIYTVTQDLCTNVLIPGYATRLAR